MNATQWRTFTEAALRSPRLVGAIAPSSSQLAERLATVVPDRGHPVVVELGPGTGAVTKVIAARLGGRGHQIAVEADTGMLSFFRQHHPGVSAHHADAADIQTVLEVEGHEHVDAVISGLPWTLFGHAKQQLLLERITEVLAPEGVFTTFAYLQGLALPAGRQYRRLLQRTFGEVLPTRTIWANMPPAITYVCRRPRR
ncbi:class I SAM-dependent methyltransferase [Lentzea cavernae]|uniref:Methyltransferase n=1 Tax=Lentzea cavernae TaxID=2020703 RepID=A0ABQ3MIG1_9PSEU|nr:methyltransferase domain-containing protein [Lentzea cavernae]GHH43760.1 methyltransferase [Lentzea cavernae]